MSKSEGGLNAAREQINILNPKVLESCQTSAEVMALFPEGWLLDHIGYSRKGVTLIRALCGNIRLEIYINRD